METTYSTSNNQELVTDILKDKEVAFEFQKRKHPNWLENYLLYRDKVITNRLTQRQSINVPIMAETLTAWLSKIDEAPIMEYEAKNSKDVQEKQKAIYWNAIWLDYFEKWKLDEIDAMDKKVVGLQGRSFKKLYWYNDDLQCKVVDPYDIDIDPKMNPLDIESASFLIHKNIFLPVRELMANESYDKAGKSSLSMYLSSGQGKFAMADSEEARQHQQQRLETLGVTNFEEFGSSDIIVEVNEIFKNIWNETEKKYVRHYIVMAANHAILYNKPLVEAIGVSFLPFTTWAEDPDLNDIWNDGKADRVRPMNKVMNTWLSQLIENRTFRNFTMFFYDSTNPKYKPTAFDPQPFGMYPLPGKPSEVLQPVPVGALSDSLNELNYFKGMIEGVSSITATEKGQGSQKQTLGEVQIDLRESSMITASSSKYYRNSWEEFASKFQAMLEANRSENYKLYKAGHNGDLQEKIISPYQTQSKSGFKVRAKLKSDVENKNNETMKKLIFIKQTFEDNPVAQKLVKEQMLGLVGWNIEDIDAVMKVEEAKLSPTPANPAGMPTDQGGGAGAVPSGIDPDMYGKVFELATGKPRLQAQPITQ